MRARTLDIRYVAGLFDGEGYVRIARWVKPNSNHIRHQIYLGIGMNFRPVIEALQKSFGGSTSINQHSKRNPNSRDQFVWNVVSQDAYKFLKAILPYLIVKREETEIAIEFQESINKWNYHKNRKAFEERREKIIAEREELFHRITVLKHRTFAHVVSRGPKRQ